MGMYTEIFVNADLKPETPDEVIATLKAMCEKDADSPHLEGRPVRWPYLFNGGSFYVPCTECALLTYSDERESYSLLAKGDIQNDDGEIQQFFEFIKPWCEHDFIGYMRYEENREPKLIFKQTCLKSIEGEK